MVDKFNCEVTFGKVRSDVLSENRHDAQRGLEEFLRDHYGSTPDDLWMDIDIRADCEVAEQNIDPDDDRFEWYIEQDDQVWIEG